MIETAAQIIYYGLSLLFAVYSFLIVYVLLRFAQSRAAAILLALLYVCALLVAFSTAQFYFSQIPFADLTI